MPKNNNLLKNRSMFSITKATYNGNIKMPVNHFHENYEIIYVQKNYENLYTKSTNYKLNSDIIAFIPPMMMHKTACDNNHETTVISISFSAKFLEKICSVSNSNILLCFNTIKPILELSEDDKIYFSNTIETLLNEYDSDAAYSSVRLMLCLSDMLIHASRMAIKDSKLKPESNEITNISSIMYDVAKFIEANYNEKINLDILSKKFFLSTCYISRTFKKHIGISIVDYTNQFRISKAQQLLESTDNITSVALTTGFDSLTHFERVFKNITGLTPSAYHDKIELMNDK